MQRIVRYLLLVYNFSSFFSSMGAEISQSFLTCVRVRRAKLSSNCFPMNYPEPLIYSHN